MLARRLIVLGNAPTWQEQLLALFTQGDDVGIWHNYKVSGTSTTLYLYQHRYQNLYWRVDFGPYNMTEGGSFQSFTVQNIVRLYKAYNDLTSPAYTQSGTWTQSSNAGYPGTSLRFCATAGAYLEQAIPNCTTLGALNVSAGNPYGVFKVSIDGDLTLADLLPTAQDLVTSGALAATVLVANGGTLGPTDRVWDQYQNAISFSDTGGNYHRRLFTTSLAAGSHTLRLTVTGYKNELASAATCNVYQLLGTGPGVRSRDAGNDWSEAYQSVDTGNTWWISYSFKPTGAAGFLWLGHLGQDVVSIPPVIVVDNVTTVLADDGKASGDRITVTIGYSVRHTEIDAGATDLGTLLVTVTMDRREGLTVAHTLTWATDGEVSGYPAMMALDHSVYDRYKSYQQAEKDLTANDNSNNLNSSENVLWAWDYDGQQAAVMHIPSLALTVENWTKATAAMRFWWNDISANGGIWKKAYATRYKTSLPYHAFAANDVIQSSVNYRVNWFPSGANAALAGRW